MSDGGFLSQETETIQGEATTLAMNETPAAAPILESPRALEAAASIAFVEGEDEVAAAERAAVVLMEAADDSFLEQAGEQTAESRPSIEQTAGVSASAVPSAVVPLVIKDDVLLDVEHILEDGLQAYVNQLTASDRQRFEKKGLEVAAEIAGMVRTFHVRVQKVLTLIKAWLLTVPGVNKFFLEQEAKIKTDRILELERVRREQAQPS